MGVPGPLNRGEWRKPEFRQNVRQKIEEVLRQSPNATYRNAGKLEAYSYASSSSKDQYLAAVAQLIIQFKETEPRRAPLFPFHGSPRSFFPMRPLRTMVNRVSGTAADPRRSASAPSSSGSSNPQVMMVTWGAASGGAVGTSRSLVPPPVAQAEVEQAAVAGAAAAVQVQPREWDD